MLNDIQKHILEVVAGMKNGEAAGAVNIRTDGKKAYRSNSEHITIESKTDKDGIDFCKKLHEVGVHTVIYTDISRDGMLGGTNLAVYEELTKIKGMRIIASGCITHIDEIKKLAAMNVRRVVLGKALYDGVLNLEQTIKECQDVS